jgi:hypothetical protein
LSINEERHCHRHSHRHHMGFQNTKGSVFMTILVHASIDTFSLPLGTLFAPADVGNSILLRFGGLVLVIVILTRGRLGYREEEPLLSTAPN